MTDFDLKFMQLALDEAIKGRGRTSPNPCVGAVIVKDGSEISRGYHKKAGGPHAEIHALRKAGKEARGATIYVTLEPCSHTGKTPPCSEAIINAGLKRVVVGMRDPNPLVDGGGVRQMENHGIDVVCGVLEEQCRAINEPFIKHILTGLPLVILKAGLSLDGKITYKRGEAGWITNEKSSKQVHGLRDLYDAILVGKGTLDIDNPSLTCRLPQQKGQDPLRVIIDGPLTISIEAKVVQQQSESETWIFCCEDVFDHKKKQLLEQLGVSVFPVSCLDGRVDLRTVFQYLGDHGVTSVLVEGGATIHGCLLKERLADKATLFISPRFIGDKGTSLINGFSAINRGQSISLDDVIYKQLGNDLMVEGNIVYPQFKGQ